MDGQQGIGHFETVPLASLSFDPANARKHPEKNLDAIKGSLARFGQQKPIVVTPGGVVVAGNGTLAAARALGWESVQVVRTQLTGTDLTAFALADNRTAELAEWDPDVIGPTLASLKAMDFDIESIGFDDDFLTAHLPEEVPDEGLTDPDEVPENVDTRCKPGDLWVLEKHRLLCGDSTNVQHVERLMGGDKADMVFTDPPYGMNLNADYSSMHKKVKGSSTAKAKVGSQGSKWKNVEGDDQPFDPSLILTLFDSAREIFMWGADYYCDRLPIGTFLVWDKNNGNEAADAMIGNDAYEMAWSREKHKKTMARIFGRGTFGHDKIKVHPTQKPVQLAEWFFERWGKAEDLVADLFLGSGSTLIACEKTGRRCFGMELDPKYCDVILTRWEKFTGKTASLAPVESATDG